MRWLKQHAVDSSSGKVMLESRLPFLTNGSMAQYTRLVFMFLSQVLFWSMITHSYVFDSVTGLVQFLPVT